MQKKKVLFIVGATATGKTDLALHISSEIASTLLSADSVQVYKGLDVISGKDKPVENKFVFDSELAKEVENSELAVGYYQFTHTRLYGVDLVAPSYSFNVSDFIKVALPAISYISSLNNLPIVVGGTAYYINALINGIDTVAIVPNSELRLELQNKTIVELQELLREKDKKKFESMNESDNKNPRRLIRAIEVSGFKDKHTNVERLEGYDIFIAGLFTSRELQKERIDKRVAKRLDQGAIDEAKKLFENYESLSNQVKNANGYKQLFSYLKKEISFENALEAWKRSEYLNAKKQMTFFKKMDSIQWFDIMDESFPQNVTDEVRGWLTT